MLRWLGRAAVLAVLLYIGVALGFPYYQYVMMQRAVEEAADTAMTRLEAMRKAGWSEGVVVGQVTATVTAVIQTRATGLRLDLPPDRIQVVLERDLFRIGTNWETEARLPGYARRLQFRVEARRILM
jgi:hypothetical protein